MRKRPTKSLEEIVAEVGRYPIDAYVFVQECIGGASEHAHGTPGPDEALVMQWMSVHELDLDDLRHRAADDELPPDVAGAVERVGGVERLNRHVTGQQLCWAVRDIALKRWGLMARGVLARWNITRTEDIGVIIFVLVNHDWLQKQPQDTREDFDQVFSFDEAFDQEYRIGTE